MNWESASYDDRWNDSEIDCWKEIIYQTEATNAILTY